MKMAKLAVQLVLYRFMQYLKEYQGFALNLQELSRMLLIIAEGITEKQSQLSEAGFGDNKVRGLKEYLKDFDLLGQKNQLTLLGELVLKNDSRFKEYFTKWLFLYHWSIKRNNPFMNFLINDHIGTGEDNDIIRKFKHWANRNDVKTDYEGTKLNGLINRTKSALIDAKAYQPLNLFVIYDGTLQRSEPYYVHTYLLAYIFYLNRNGRTSIGFKELLEERGNIAKFFHLNSKELDIKIAELMNIGVARMIQHADLHLIEFTYSGSPISLLQKYYDEY